MAEFPVNANDRRIQYSASAAQTVFPYDFPAFADTELAVFRTRAGATTTLTLSSDYTVDGLGAQNGGNVTLTAGAQAADVITIKGAMPVARTSDYQEGGDFRAATINRDLDRLVIMMQEQATRLARVLRQPDEDASDLATLAGAAARANKFLAFDGAGQPVLAAGTSANLGPVSGFVNTLLDDADAAGFLGTLGVSTFIKTLLDDADAPSAQATLDIAPQFNCRFVKNGANVELQRFDGDQVFVNGQNRTLPATHPTRAPTGLTANTNYYAYLLANSGTVTNRARSANVATITTAAAHGLEVGSVVSVAGVGSGYDATGLAVTAVTATTFSYANVGSNEGTTAATGTITGLTIELSTTVSAQDATYGHRIKSGDTTRTLVGLLRTIAGPAFADTEAQRFVISHHNRRRIHARKAMNTSADVSTVSAALTELNGSTARAEFLSWADESLAFGCNGGLFSGATGNVGTLAAHIDGVLQSGVGAAATAGGANHADNAAHSGQLSVSEGYHYVSPFGAASGGTTTFVGGTGVNSVYSWAVLNG
jgi:hypothetical protein